MCLVCLGIDPGLARVGYGAVMKSGAELRAMNYGCIETTPAMSFTERLLKIYTDLQEQIGVCAPDFVSVERLFFGRNTTTAEYVYQARGVIMLLAAQNNLPVFEPAPNHIKLSLCGNGRADKHTVQETIREVLSLDEIPRPDDTADALAAAVAGLSHYEGG
ncbi:MAG: crossover junction endodeoxyribonuclease RuvC [Synergistaceae bacterium]|nr:crossover junction endodeoxyribonuclease RuvC [Synergistaceae bacterium]